MKRIILPALAAALIALASRGNADLTGMSPGDILIDNIRSATAPGHAGIYIGRWALLPANLRQTYARALQEADVRSGVAELLDSYLVVDSMPGRGVRVTPFVEQFTEYHGGTNQRFPLLKKFDMLGIQKWEFNDGAAISWNELPANDLRRMKIVEEALKLAMAHTPYDETHMQWDTTRAGSALRTVGLRSLTLDCIALCHYIHSKAAGIDLDVSWAPYHDNRQLLDYARQNKFVRITTFLPVLWDTAYLGLWKPAKIDVATSGMTRGMADEARREFGSFPADTRFEMRRNGPEFKYTLWECRSGKRVDGSALTLRLDKSQPRGPIEAGKAILDETRSGAMTGRIRFMPISADQAIMETHMTAPGKDLTLTVTLTRERQPRPVAR